jgi:hypothetical protein
LEGFVSKFLNEHEIGFDQDHIGFPNLADCMAVVLLTQNGLFGHHITPGNDRQAGAFSAFIRARNPGSMLCLYGTCYRPRRYGGSKSPKADWKTEMTRVANLLNYNGRVSGFDTSSGTNIESTETTYVEYHRDHGKCTIFYKRMSKMDMTKSENPADDPIQRAYRLPGTDHYTTRPEDFALKNQPMKIVASADLIRTHSNKGKLHEVSSAKLDLFSI